MEATAKKLIVGCGAGCLALAVLSIGACVSFSFWVKQPGGLLEPTRLLGADTTGYVEWTLRAEDPGTEAFVDGLLEFAERTDDGQAQGGPAWMRGLLNRRRQKKAEQVRALLPTVAVWTVAPGTREGTDVHLLTLSIKSLGNRSRFWDVMLRYTLGLKYSEKYGDERIYTADDKGAMFIRDNSFFVTNSQENARLIVDRMRGQVWDPARDPTELETRMSAFSGDRPLRGMIDNSRGELWRIFSSLAELESGTQPPEPWNSIESATLTGGLTAGQTAFSGTIDLRGPDTDWARNHADGFLARLRADYGRGHLPVELRSEAQGDSIRISFLIEDVFALLDEL